MEDDRLQNIDDTLRELSIVMATMDVAYRLQNMGMSKIDALIAARVLTFILEEMPDDPEKRAEKAEALAPELHKLARHEIAQAKAKEASRDRES